MKFVKILSLLALFALIFSVGSGLFAMDKKDQTADRSAKQFDRETEAKARRAAERERQEVQAIADELNAQQAPDPADVDSDDEVEANRQADLKDAVAHQESQTEQDLKAAEDILYNLKPVNAKIFSGPGLPKKLQKLVAEYALGEIKTEKHQEWRLFKTIEGLKKPYVAKIIGKSASRGTKKVNLLDLFCKGQTKCDMIGNYLVTGESDGSLKLWSIMPFACMGQRNLGFPIHSIAVSENGNLIAVSFSNTKQIIVYEFQEKRNKDRIAIHMPARTINAKHSKTELFFENFEDSQNKSVHEMLLAFSSDCFSDKSSEEWRTVTPKEYKTWAFLGTIPWEQVNDGENQYIYNGLHHRCCVSDFDVRVPNNEHNKKVRALSCFHINDHVNYLVEAMYDGTIQAYEMIIHETPEVIIRNNQNDINGLQTLYSTKKDVLYLFVSADDCTIKIWENILQDRFKKCGHCKKDKHAQKGTDLQWCACKAVKYCSRECQKEDWKNHKTTCTANPKLKKDNSKA